MGANVNTTPESTAADCFDRVMTLELALIETRDALRVCAAALDHYSEAHATQADAADASLINGVSIIIDEVMARCERVFWEGAKDDE